MEKIRNIEKFNFELKIAVLLVVVWAGWFQHNQNQNRNIDLTKKTEKKQNTDSQVDGYPAMIVLKKI